MPLQAPKLDDRTFAQIEQEARERIPRYTPEWTDLNESDPGITFLKLHAWLTETILYRLNQLPELAYVKFLQLLGGEQRPATPAQADLTFTVRERATGSEVTVPRGTVVKVDDPNLAEQVFFETDEEILAISATLHQVAVWVTETQPPDVKDVTQSNRIEGQTFAPFSEDGANDPALMLGFLSDKPFTRETVGLTFKIDPSQLAFPDDPLAGRCGEDDGTTGRLVWEWWDGAIWAALTVVADDTSDLTTSGRVSVRVTGQIPAVSARTLDLIPVARTPRFSDIQGIVDALTDDIGAAVGAAGHDIGTDADTAMATTPFRTVADLARLNMADPAATEAVLRALGLDDDPDRVSKLAAIVDEANRLAQGLLPLYWLRARQVGPFEIPPRIERVLTNTVRATAARSVANEVLGSSDGSPNQVMTLRNRPVLAPQPPGIETGANGESPAAIQPLDLAVVEAGVTTGWARVVDFASSGPQDTHYVLNRTTGQILFGDGIHGRIPIAGQANIIARSYRYGGGTIGNVGKETIKNLNSPITDIGGVLNVEAADGGADEESLTDAKLRIPKDLKAIDRAVTLEDYAHLAKLTPGAQIERAVAFLPDPTDERPHPPITVVVLPQSQATNPTPSEATKRRVCRYLNDRRLVTTRLAVTGPEYLAIDVTIDVRVRDDVGLRETSEQIDRDLKAFFSPLALDETDQPWPFGGTIYYSEVLANVMAVTGVRFIATLDILAVHGQFKTEPEAADYKAELEAARGAAENLPPFAVVPVAVAAVSSMSDPTTEYAVQADYNCVDIPLAPHQLVHLRKTTITVDYVRGRSG